MINKILNHDLYAPMSAIAAGLLIGLASVYVAKEARAINYNTPTPPAQTCRR